MAATRPEDSIIRQMLQMQQLSQQRGLQQYANQYQLQPGAIMPSATPTKKRKFKPGDIIVGNAYADMQYGTTVTGTKWRVIEVHPITGEMKVIDPEGVGAEFIVQEDHFDLLEKARKKTDGKVMFDTVILPEYKKKQILAAVDQVNYHDLIFNEWGFGEIFEKGTAISMLFYGPPGTGKTLMAQAIADKLDYKLKMVDSALIESSEPGQAERNMKAIFEQSNAKTLLLFDECDSLICDRSAVGMILAAQINALLTGLENFKGIAIFTTNRLGSLDEAMNRRLSLKLEFDMPDHHHRKLIWQRMFPKQAPVAKDLDWDKLASVEITGGYVKNVVLRAARMAATSTKKITTDIVMEALTLEVESLVQFQEAVKKSPRTPRQDFHRSKG